MTADAPSRTSTPPAGTPAVGPSAATGRHTVKKPRPVPYRPGWFSLSNWPVSARLVAVFLVASITGLVFGGLRVSDAVNTSDTYGRTAQVALLGQQSTVLAQAMEDERDLASGVAAYDELAADAAARKAARAVADPITKALASEEADLTAAERVTDAQAQRTKTLAGAIGPEFPAGVQAKATGVVTMIDSIPGLRSQVLGEPAVAVIDNYSSSIADLFGLTDEITSGSGDAELADDVRALGALSRATNEASQQRAFVYSTLIESSVYDAGSAARPYNTIGTQSLQDAGGLAALTTSQGLEFADLTDFNEAATTDESNAYQDTVAGRQNNDAQLIEGFVSLNGDPRLAFERIGHQTSLGYDRATVPATWFGDMTTVLSEMRAVEAQVMSAIVARSQMLEQQGSDSATLTAVVTGVAVLLVLLATVLVGRTLVNPLRRLQADALEIAAVRLPARVAAAATGTEGAEGSTLVEPIGVQSTDEIGRVARAFDQVHAEAVRLAGTEAQLRGSLNAMFISLSRRSVPLIDRLSRVIDGMEQTEDDPDQLARLFSMDHLVTRMRRNSENLLVLAGEEPVRKWTESVSLADVSRAAASEIEQYSRVALAVQPGIMIPGQAAADVVHLLAELIENATLFSPQHTQVRVTVMELSSGGVLVEVRDDGVGISPIRLADMNWRLDHPPVVDVSISRHMGLYAVARLAARHGIRVKLRPGAPQGLSALVWLPGTLAKREPGSAARSHARPFGVGVTGSLMGGGTLPLASTSGYITGRHRSGLAAEGRQPAARPAGRPTTAWFAAKRPSSGADSPAPEPAADWRLPAAPEPAADWRLPASGRMPADGAAAHAAAGRTASGLPRRTPGTSAYPGGNQPDSGFPAAPDFAAPVLGAPPGGTGLPYQEAAYPQAPYPQAPYPQAPSPDAGNQERAPSRQRSAEAARNRLSGFQLGNRDATQAGNADSPTASAGEENSR